MRAMLLQRIATIDSSPLELVDLPTPEPAPGEVAAYAALQERFDRVTAGIRPLFPVLGG